MEDDMQVSPLGLVGKKKKKSKRLLGQQILISDLLISKHLPGNPNNHKWLFL